MCGGEESTALRQNPASREGKFDCAINIALHRGKICAFRSFLYGEGIMVAARVQSASAEVLPDSRGGVYVTSAARDDLAGAPWQGDSKLSRSSYGIRACLKWRSAASVACRDGVDTRHGALMATPPIPARIGPAEFIRSAPWSRCVARAISTT